ncbi:MAG: YcaO-like family protein [Bacteriovoracaceae bacterium]|nr:YcaO-like family protein [Bacteriovoracaceae bacterium]
MIESCIFENENLVTSANWSRPEFFEDCLEIDDLVIKLAGISTKADCGQILTGSAGDIHEIPKQRSFLELLERIATFEAITSDKHYQVIDQNGRQLTKVAKDDLFFINSNKDWSYSKSNGIALHFNYYEACQSAKYELIERDRILRSWYGQYAPEKIELNLNQSNALCPQFQSNYYDFEYYRFVNNMDESEVCVVGMFAFAKNDDLSPLVYGFGAHVKFTEAVEHAQRECFQRLGFLWGEDFSSQLPSFSPTPDYNQEYFLRKNNHCLIRNWLAATHKNIGSFVTDFSKENIVYVDLTPKRYKGSYVVVKAISDKRVPLIFGRRYEVFGNQIPKELMIHPVV